MKFTEKEKQIANFKIKYPFELLVFKKLDNKILLICHGKSEEEVGKILDKMIDKGWIRQNETLFFR